MLVLSPWNRTREGSFTVDTPVDAGEVFQAIDLRAPGQRSGWSLLSTEEKSTDHIVLCGPGERPQDVRLGAGKLDAIRRATGRTFQGDLLKDQLLQLFTTGADETGNSHNLPLIPRDRSRLVLRLGRYSVSGNIDLRRRTGEQLPPS